MAHYTQDQHPLAYNVEGGEYRPVMSYDYTRQQALSTLDTMPHYQQQQQQQQQQPFLVMDAIPQQQQLPYNQTDPPLDGGASYQESTGCTTSSQEEGVNKETDIVHAVLGLPQLHFYALVTSLGLGLFLAVLDASIVATSLYSIAAEFQELETIHWVALSYSLAFLSCSVLSARISDVVGRRAAFLTSWVVFIAFSLGCGFSQNLDQLVACRVFQGIGGAGLYSIPVVALPEIATPDQKKLISGVLGMTVAVAGVLGPVLGGILTEYADWRWVFWINGPIGVASVVLFIFMWPDEKYLPAVERRRWKDLDYLGSFLLIASAALIVFPFQNAGLSHNSWSKPVFFAPLLAGLVALAALFVWQYYIDRRWVSSRYHKRRQIAAAIPLSLLRNRVYAATVLNTICTGFPYLLTVYVFPLRFQVVNGRNPLQAGVMMLPMLVGSGVGTAVSGFVNGDKNRLFETLVASCLLSIVGCAGQTTLSSSGDYEPKALGLLTLIGLGFGLAAAASTIMGHQESSMREHATAQGIVAQVRMLGGSIGIAASSAVLGTKTASKLAGILTPQQLGHLASTMDQLPSDVKQAVRETYTEALRQDMIICCGVTALGLLFTLGAYRPWSMRLTMTEATEKHLREENERRRREEGLCGGE